MLWLLCLTILLWDQRPVQVKARSAPLSNMGKGSSPCFQHNRLNGIATYYINRNEDTERRHQTEAMLMKIGLPYMRVSAIFPNSSEYNILMLEQPCKRNTPTDISVILSHLKAIYTAVHDSIPITRKRSILDDYALILEDDVRFVYDIDFKALIENAPRKFGILQLITTNPDAVNSLWYNFNTARCGSNTTAPATNSTTSIGSGTALTGTNANTAAMHTACADYPTLVKNYKPKPVIKKKSTQWNQDDYVPLPPEPELTPQRLRDLEALKLWAPRKWDDLTRNGRQTLYWSTQAYIINKRVAWKFLVDIMEVGKIPAGFSKTKMAFNASRIDNDLGFKIVNSFVGHACSRRPERPCILGSCLFAYSYIYSAAQPAYVAQIPLLMGSKTGLETTLHPEQHSEYKKAFKRIKGITGEMRGTKKVLLPEYIAVPSADCL